MPRVIEREQSIEIREDMTWDRRVLFLLLGFFPLIAPYELLIEPEWNTLFNFFFLLSLLISLGAIFVSGFLFFAAFAGLSTLLKFDAARRECIYIHHAPIVPFRRDVISYDAIDRIDLEQHDWTDGAPSFSVRVQLRDEGAVKSASFQSQEGASATLDRVLAHYRH